jgi:hypothetical protein
MKIITLMLFLQRGDQLNILRIYCSLPLISRIRLMLTLVTQEACSSSNDDNANKNDCKSHLVRRVQGASTMLDLMMMMMIEFLSIQCNRQETIRSFCLPDFMVIVFCSAINQRPQSFRVVSQSYALTGCLNLLEAVQPNSRGSVSVLFI